VPHEEDKPQQYASAVMQLVRQTHAYHRYSHVQHTHMPISVTEAQYAHSASSRVWLCCSLQESWSQLPAVLSWFSTTVLQLHPSAKLSFPACLPKDLRADVHT
jgi:hypothetical protein